MSSFVYYKKNTVNYTSNTPTVLNVFQYYSDIHLEHHPSEMFIINPIQNHEITLNPKDEEKLLGNSRCCELLIKKNLILAGDIGSPYQQNYWNFLTKMNDLFDNVFIICGNHEYYGSSIEEVNTQFKPYIQKLKLSKIHFLNNDYIIQDDCMIIGTTLWSHIPEKAKQPVLDKLNDYKLIKNFNIEKNNDLHNQATSFIDTSLQKASELNIKHKIIITHHAPLMKGTSAPCFENEITTHAFSTDCIDLINKSSFWIYGHTHHNPIIPIHPNLYTNQIGYSWNKENNIFKSERYFYTI